MSRKIEMTKRYVVEIPGTKPVVIRTTSTLTHALKHAAYASELRINVRVRDNETRVTVIDLPAIDRAHAIKPKTKRDRRYAKRALKATHK